MELTIAIHLATELWGASISMRTPNLVAINKLMSEYRIGDWVFIDHAVGQHNNRIGILIKDEIGDAQVGEWNIIEDGPIPQDRFWTIRTEAGLEIRWYNVQPRRIYWTYDEYQAALRGEKR